MEEKLRVLLSSALVGAGNDLLPSQDIKFKDTEVSRKSLDL